MSGGDTIQIKKVRNVHYLKKLGRKTKEEKEKEKELLKFKVVHKKIKVNFD